MEEKDKTNEIEVIEIEIFTREDKTVPPGKHYIIKIDQKKYTVKKDHMTGRDILILAGKNPPERFQLNQRLKGGKVVKIGYDQEVSFLQPGIEKFMTIPLDQTEG